MILDGMDMASFIVLQICSAVGVPAEDLADDRLGVDVSHRRRRRHRLAAAAEVRARGGGLPARWRIWQGGHQGGWKAHRRWPRRAR